MPIDTSAFNQPLIPEQDALGQMAKVASLRNAGLETQTRQFQLGQAQRAAQNAKAVQDAIRQGGGDMQKTHELLSKVGDEHALEMNTIIEQHLATIDKLGAEKIKQNAENDKETARATSERAGMIANVPDEQVSQVYADKKLPEWPSEQQLREKGLTLPVFLSSLIPAEAWNKHIADAAELKIKQAKESRDAAESAYRLKGGDTEQQFQNFYAGWLAENGKTKSAVVEPQARRAYQDSKRTSQLKTPEEEAQAIRIAGANRAPVSEPLVPTTDAQGNTTYTPRSQAAGMKVPTSSQNKPPTSAERKMLGFYERVSNSLDSVDSMERDIAKMSNSLYDQAQLTYAPNFLQSPVGKRFTQAKNDFINASLRRESGAAISDGEYKRFDQIYFPRPGDDAPTLLQKKKARDVQLETFKTESGKAFAEKYGDEGSGGPPKELDETTAMDFLKNAGGDKEKARTAAKAAGYKWN